MLLKMFRAEFAENAMKISAILNPDSYRDSHPQILKSICLLFSFVYCLLFFRDYSFRCNFRSDGSFQAAAATEASAMQPPKTTDGIRPMILAAKPDSKAPISLDELMNMVLTDETRPRMLSG